MADPLSTETRKLNGLPRSELTAARNAPRDAEAPLEEAEPRARAAQRDLERAVATVEKARRAV